MKAGVLKAILCLQNYSGRLDKCAGCTVCHHPLLQYHQRHGHSACGVCGEGSLVQGAGCWHLLSPALGHGSGEHCCCLSQGLPCCSTVLYPLASVKVHVTSAPYHCVGGAMEHYVSRDGCCGPLDTNSSHSDELLIMCLHPVSSVDDITTLLPAFSQQHDGKNDAAGLRGDHLHPDSGHHILRHCVLDVLVPERCRSFISACSVCAICLCLIIFC